MAELFLSEDVNVFKERRDRFFCGQKQEQI